MVLTALWEDFKGPQNMFITAKIEMNDLHVKTLLIWLLELPQGEWD